MGFEGGGGGLDSTKKKTGEKQGSKAETNKKLQVDNYVIQTTCIELQEVEGTMVTKNKKK